MLRQLFLLQLPAGSMPLYSQLYRVAVFPVDGVDGVHQSVSLVTVNGVEHVMLDVVSDFGDDYTSLFVLVSSEKYAP